MTGANAAIRLKAISVAAVAVAVLLGSLTAGVLAVRSPAEGVMLIGLFGCVIVYLTGPYRMVWIALFLSFASLPAMLNAGKILGPVHVYPYQVLVVLAITFLIPLARLRFSEFALPLVFLATVMYSTAFGVLSGNDVRLISGESVTLCEMIGGFVLALLIVRTGHVRQSIRLMGGVLWFSAGMIIVSSFTGLKLAGRAERFQEGVSANEAVRILTTTQTPALAVLIALVAMSVVGRARRSTWFAFGAPALVITLLGFSRNTLIALTVAIVVTAFANRNWAVVRRTAALASIAVSAALAVIASAFLLHRTGTGDWLTDQLTAFSHRVFGGVSESALAKDSSTQDRLKENVNLWRAIGEAPLLGHGLGFAYQEPALPPRSFADVEGTAYAHNFYLWLLAKAGLFGMAGFALFAFVPVVRAMRTPAIEAQVAATVAASLLVICVVNPLPEGGSNSLALGMAIGAAMAFSRPRTTASTDQHNGKSASANVPVSLRQAGP